MNRERGTDEVPPEDCDSAAENKGKGNKLSILAFRGGFHGRTTGCISCTNTRGKIKVQPKLSITQDFWDPVRSRFFKTFL